MPKEIQALILDEMVESRNRLRHAVLASQNHIQVRVALTMRDALQLAEEAPADSPFLSSELTRAHGEDFLNKFSTLESKGTSFIMVLQGEQRAPATIVERFAAGVDGFILDPYSADDIRLVIEHSAELKIRNSTGRKKNAVEFLVRSAQKLIDQAATLHLADKPLGETVREIRRTRSALARLNPLEHGDYGEQLLKVFLNAPITPLHAATRQALETQKLQLLKRLAAEEEANKRRAEAEKQKQQRRIIRRH